MDALKLTVFTSFFSVFSVYTSAYSVDYVNHTYVTAETTAGTIRGMRTLQTDGKYLDVYLGVPFADPPLGNLRFAAPKNPTPWDGIRNAFAFKSRCPEPDNPNGDEDCLYLNVYTPFANSDTNTGLAVMLWIHGGCFVYGTAEDYDGSILAQNGVVIVTVNYRIGSLGFLSTGDSVAAGNWGLLDNVMALQWVQDNIANFGGDPNKVTVFGQSSGGVSASLLQFSPLATGLINGVIAISGTATAPWAIYGSRDPYHVNDTANQLAELLNCPTSSSEEIILCLRTKTWNELVNTHVEYPADWCEWTPNVDGYFILDDPINLLHKGEFLKVPLLSGAVKDELAYPGRTMTREAFERRIQFMVDAPLFAETGNTEALYDALVYEYINPEDPDNTEEIRNQWVQLYTDYDYISPCDYHSQWNSKEQNQTYKYAFHYNSVYNPNPEWFGVTHSYDLFFLFGTPLLYFNRTCPWGCDGGNWYNLHPRWSLKDKQMSELVMKLFTNFPKYGNPTPTPVNDIRWEAFDDAKDAYLELNTVSEVKYDYRARRMLFWQDYFQKVMSREQPPPVVMTPLPVECPVSSGTFLRRRDVLLFVALVIVHQILTQGN